ncbi:hypothetical protein HYW43_04625 [Candidatus Daviesbacteria bacterium]|nr:hypothetical protein [Candidatus Daviesbacteria bacterium]
MKLLKRNKENLFVTLAVISIAVFAQYKFQLFYNPNTITLGFIGTYQEHDLPLEVTRLLSQSLVEVDLNAHLKGKLLYGWEVNNDATVFKLKLRDNLSWVDGLPIQAADLEIGIPNLDIKNLDGKTVQITLKDAYSPFPSLLTKPIFKKGTLTGTGPYKITRLEKSRIFITKIELQPNDPKLPKIFIRFYPNEKVAATGFNLGEVQALFAFSNPKTFNGNTQVSLLQKVDFGKIVSILFQTKDAMLSSRSLRQALSFVTPKIEGEIVADNPYPASFWAYNPDSKKYLSNMDEAKEALDRAKSSLPEDKLKEEIILTATSNLEEVGNKVVGEWKKLGLNAKLRVESGVAQNFQALLITQSIPQDPDQYFLWHATQEKTNLTKYDSKRADKDLEDGRKIISEEERKTKYFDFQKTLLEDAPAVFLYFPKYNIAYLKKAKPALDQVLNLHILGN